MSLDGIALADTKGNTRRANVRRSVPMRSRVGNGKTLLAGIDQRSLPYREYQDTVADLVAHMGNTPTAAEEAMIEEAAGLIVWCRQARLALLQGDKFEISPYCTAVNSLRRLLTDLGLEGRLQDVTPALEQYLAQTAREAATDAEASEAT